MLEPFLSVDGLIALATLTFLEVILGVDNVIFISILAGKLPPDQQPRARRLGLAAAMITRLLLLMSLAWMIRLTQPLFTLFEHAVSGRDLILLAGGLFLLGKATLEIHEKLEGDEGHASARVYPSFAAVIFQIMVLDIVFSIDSVITAVGMVKNRVVMVVAVIVSVGVMMVFANAVCDFVERHPTIKMLALSFLILIGVLLVAEGMHKEIPKSYVYFAMAFSLGVEFLNIRLRRVSTPVQLRHTQLESDLPPSPPKAS